MPIRPLSSDAVRLPGLAVHAIAVGDCSASLTEDDGGLVGEIQRVMGGASRPVEIGCTLAANGVVDLS